MERARSSREQHLERSRRDQHLQKKEGVSQARELESNQPHQPMKVHPN